MVVQESAVKQQQHDSSGECCGAATTWQFRRALRSSNNMTVQESAAEQQQHDSSGECCGAATTSQFRRPLWSSNNMAVQESAAEVNQSVAGHKMKYTEKTMKDITTCC